MNKCIVCGKETDETSFCSSECAEKFLREEGKKETEPPKKIEMEENYPVYDNRPDEIWSGGKPCWKRGEVEAEKKKEMEEMEKEIERRKVFEGWTREKAIEELKKKEMEERKKEVEKEKETEPPKKIEMEENPPIYDDRPDEIWSGGKVVWRRGEVDKKKEMEELKEVLKKFQERKIKEPKRETGLKLQEKKEAGEAQKEIKMETEPQNRKKEIEELRKKVLRKMEGERKIERDTEPQKEKGIDDIMSEKETFIPYDKQCKKEYYVKWYQKNKEKLKRKVHERRKEIGASRRDDEIINIILPIFHIDSAYTISQIQNEILIRAGMKIRKETILQCLDKIGDIGTNSPIIRDYTEEGDVIYKTNKKSPYTVYLDGYYKSEA